MKKIIVLLILMVAVSLTAIQSDKVLHGWGCFMISIGTMEITESVPVSFVVPALIGISVEYIQKNNPDYGVYNPEDIIANLVGAVLCIPLNCWLHKTKRSDEEKYRREQYLERYGTEYPIEYGKCPNVIDLRRSNENY